MTAFARKLLTRLGMLAALSILVYAGVDLLPGDPVTSRLGISATPEQAAALRARLGLDRPLPVRYAEWVSGLFSGNLGVSVSGRPVTEMLSDRVGNSALLAGLAVLLLAPLSLGLGLWAAWRRGRVADKTISAGALLMASVPEFVVAGGLVLLFAVTLRWFPAVSLLPAGANPLAHPEVLVLPVASLVLVGSAYAVRVIRGAATQTLAGPQAEFLRLNGVRWPVLARRLVVPAVLPVAVQVWLVTGVALVGGAVLVEKVFGYPGIGELLVSSVQTGDLPVVQAVVLVLGALMLLALLLADLAVVLLTPRLRTGGAR
ncbi:ABC transporter permease [Amycolatopsis sp. WAC 04182]|uniref:ABC transporter permease n=1 Tax=Amycolatopsis sp. WAC 04182 TaxID=2203198 RepID=UPI001F472ABC|nr:ABC transporter permease [Amycolatopsis sp. WAC 04182]